MEICVCIVASAMLFELSDAEVELTSIIQDKRKTSDWQTSPSTNWQGLTGRFISWEMHDIEFQ